MDQPINGPESSQSAAREGIDDVVNGPEIQRDQPLAYLPIDRRYALAYGKPLTDRMQGAALFADISGFTSLTEALALELGYRRGAEELTHHLNHVYDAVITELHRYGGSVVGFSGDAITCWLDGDDGMRATACALAMQKAMEQFISVRTPSGQAMSLAMKTAVVSGSVRRFLVGDPEIQVFDVMAGATLDRLAAAEHQAKKGELVLDLATAQKLSRRLDILSWRLDEQAGERFAVVGGLAEAVEPHPWPPIDVEALHEEQIRPWLIPAVYQRLQGGRGEFLAELRPTLALFLRFRGIDYDRDPRAETRLDTFIRQVQEILGRYQGALLQLTMGDKGSYLYAAFGAPIAHEDDAVRAASAALEFRAMAAGLDFISDIQIGITEGRTHTGSYGGSQHRTYGVLGDNVNLAARLMAAAAPGEILTNQSAWYATGEVFRWEHLPNIKVKGKKEKVMIFSLKGLRERQTVRLREPRYAIPMVGRLSELYTVLEKMDQSMSGEGQIVGISGEAGIGKSRLIAEIIRSANERELAGFGGECQSYGTKSSYMVWQTIWLGIFDLESTWSLEQHIEALEAELRRINPALLPRLPLLGTVLNIPIPHNELTGPMDAKLRKSSLEAMLIDCLRVKAIDSPMVIVLEDCHWIDPLSQDLLEILGRAIADLPVLLVLAYRDVGMQWSESPRVSALPHFTSVRIGEFNPAETEQLIQRKLTQFFGANGEVPPGLVSRVTQLAEGNPFYIEELLNYLQDQGLDLQGDLNLARLDLPTSLHSLILSRIDQLSESQKITIKVASVIGRLFKASMLWGVYPQLGQPDRVKADLDFLSRVDLTPLDTEDPELTYFFKNVVIQEVAYENLPYSMRDLLHNQIGLFIERIYQDSLDQYIDLLAYHYERSQNEPKKREYLLKAGAVAQTDYANTAAIDYYRRVIPLLPTGEQVSVLLKLGKVLELVGEWQQAGDLFQKALVQARDLADYQSEAWCQTAIGEHFRKQGLYSEAEAWLEQARVNFERLGDQAGSGQVLHHAGTLAAQQGDHETARQLYEESLAIRRKLGDQQHVAGLLSNLGIIARLQGDTSQARALYMEALDIRRELNDRWAIAISLNNLGNIALDQENYDEAQSLLEETVALQRQIGDRYNLAIALNNLGNVARARREFDYARPHYRESLVINRDLGDRWALSYLLQDIGVWIGLQGQSEHAMSLIGAAEALREAIGARLSPAEEEKLAALLEPCLESLDAGARTQALKQGRSWSLDQAIQFVSDRILN